ncbi:MAG: hypothetical protein PWP23_2396 [Candidatus Sumerlaeota bacterium]|nr:hypothetical protein [Candidatus Sumerlaeota bacterium]
MQQQSFRTALAIGLIAGAGSLAFAQEGNTTFFTGEHVVAGGNLPAFSSFDPSVNDATSRMYNDGTTAGDVSASDHIWTYSATGITPSGDPLAVETWKMATWDGVDSGTAWSHESPSGGDALYPTNEAAVDFFWVDPDGSMGDGYLPDNNFVYTSPNNIAARMQAASSFAIFGNFGTELGATGDWGDSGTHLSLTRNASTQEWEVTLSGWQNIGNKEFKAVMNGDWGPGNEIGTNGFGGGNISFFLLNKADVVTFKVREADGRYKFEGLTPLPSTDGVYALGPWTTTPETDSMMTSVADGFELTVTVPTAGQQTLTVFEISGGNLVKLWPGQGAHPFKTTTDNQEIRVNLHTASMADGAFPDSDFIYTDPASRIDFTAAANARIQIVGPLSMWGLRYGGDFDNPATDGVGSNDPVATQVGSDAFLYRWDAPTTNHGTPAPGLTKEYKAVAVTDDIAISASNAWAIQLGGVHDLTGEERKCGLSLLGDNKNPSYDFLDATDYSFFVDTATGRVKVQLATDPVPTLRPARANDAVGASNVSEWTAY